jgi:hypothetical protein
MAEQVDNHPVDTLSRNLIEARLAAAELGWPFIGYLIDMALAETRATGGGRAAAHIQAAELAARRRPAANGASVQP